MLLIFSNFVCSPQPLLLSLACRVRCMPIGRFADVKVHPEKRFIVQLIDQCFDSPLAAAELVLWFPSDILYGLVSNVCYGLYFSQNRFKSIEINNGVVLEKTIFRRKL